MDDRQLIVLYGDTLLMDGVAACLANKHELDVVRVNAALANIGQHLQSIAPDLVIFDVDTPVPELSKLIIPLLKKQPDIPFIGLDSENSEVISLCSQPHAILSTRDLVNVIQTQAAACADESTDAHLNNAFKQLRSLTQTI
jgi:DNA-binding NarL/FixJ family response regulator